MPICLCKGFFGIIYMKVNKILQLHHEQNMRKCRTIIPILWSEDQKRLMESSLSMDKTYTFNLLIIHCETHNVTEKRVSHWTTLQDIVFSKVYLVPQNVMLLFSWSQYFWSKFCILYFVWHELIFPCICEGN